MIKDKCCSDENIGSRISSHRLKRNGEASEATVDLTYSFHNRATAYARSWTEERFKKSEFGNRLDELPTFDLGELVLGKRLGRGGFSNVDEIRGIQQRDGAPSSKPSLSGPLIGRKFSRHDSMALNNKESRRFISEHCYRRSGDARYALKQIRREILNNQEQLASGLCDLAIECRFLSSLEHPNIIKLRAVSSAGPFTGDYFLILDRLNDTLLRRIGTWKQRRKQLYSFLGRFRDPKGVKRIEFYEIRLELAFDLSAAVEYLHSKRVIHRDIKPDNIGFDCRGDIKVFDFGFARELREDMKLADGTYKLSKMTGSLRYMPPEVALGRKYNFSCDVYSFAIVLWEMMALERAFSCQPWHSEAHFFLSVFEEGTRPSLDIKWPCPIRELLQSAWSQTPGQRPSMEIVTKSIRTELLRLRKGDDSSLPNHQMRRSTVIFDSEAVLQEFKDMSSSDFLDSVKSSRSRRTVINHGISPEDWC